MKVLEAAKEESPGVALKTENQPSQVPAAPASVQILIQDLSSDSPPLSMPDITTTTTSAAATTTAASTTTTSTTTTTASSEAAKSSVSGFGLSPDPPLSVSTPTGLSDPFSFPSAASVEQEGTSDPFQGLGMSDPFTESPTEAGRGEVEGSGSKEAQLGSAGFSADLLESALGDHQAVKEVGGADLSQPSQNSITDSNLLGLDQFSLSQSDASSLEPASLVPGKPSSDASSDSQPNPSSTIDSLLDFSSFEEMQGGVNASASAGTGTVISGIFSQSLAPVRSEAGSGEAESLSTVEADLLSGGAGLQGMAATLAPEAGGEKAPGFLVTTGQALMGTPLVSTELVEDGSQLLDQNLSSLDSQASSVQLAEDSSLLDFGLQTPSEAKPLHDSASTVALVDLDEFAGGEDIPVDGEGESKRSAVDDLLGM